MARMSTGLIFGVAAAIGAGVIYYSYKNSRSRGEKTVKPIDNLDMKEIDGILAFPDVVGWFKQLQLNPKNDTPFIALADKVENVIGPYFKSETKFCYPSSQNDDFRSKDKKRLLLGVYNEATDEITHALIIEADAFDDLSLIHI